jgi:hypothetical protein
MGYSPLCASVKRVNSADNTLFNFSSPWPPVIWDIRSRHKLGLFYSPQQNVNSIRQAFTLLEQLSFLKHNPSKDLYCLMRRLKDACCLPATYHTLVLIIIQVQSVTKIWWAKLRSRPIQISWCVLVI